MKLRNKKTGIIVDVLTDTIDLKVLKHLDEVCGHYTSLAELNEEWEDYNEYEYWFIDNNGDIIFTDLDDDKIWKDLKDERKTFGNYFETKEEAEKAVEKLKAWKRLKDAGFKFNNWIYDYREAEKENERGLSIGASYNQLSKVDADDLDLLFGGEE